jgi:transposase InsO family protein
LILNGEDLLWLVWSCLTASAPRPQEVFVVHANAPLTEKHRLVVAKLIVEEGLPIVQAAQRFQIAWPTAKRWAQRYRAEGEAGMRDRSSRPHHSPRTTPPRLVRAIVRDRMRLHLGPVEIGARQGVAASTVHRVLTRCRLHRLSHVDRITGEPLRRYEHPNPGDLLHVDVKKLGNIPDGGGWRYVGRRQGRRHRAATPTTSRSCHGDKKMGTAYVHTVLDDHSRVAYAEVHDDEKAATAVAVLQRATAWFADRGVTVARVLSDNGSAYRSHVWRDTCAELRITPKRTRPYRPQTNGKIERFHRTLADRWAFARHYTGESQRRDALPGWLHEYNHHRPHTAIGRQPPITRLTNVPGQYI